MDDNYLDIKSKIDNLKDQEAGAAFKSIVKAYLDPAYGSMTKRDLDILLFTELQKANIISKNAELYEIIRSLKISRAKAKNLLYESKMRRASMEDLDKELKEIIIKPIFLKDNDNISIEIDNQLLVDHIRWKLKKLGYITDGSFSADLLKLSIDAYVALFVKVTGENSKKVINEALAKCGAEEIGFSGLLKKILKDATKKVVGEATGEATVEAAVEAAEGLGKKVSKCLYEKLHSLIHARDKKSEVSKICEEAQLKD
ncbi:hypothetical protein [Gardnerella sp. KA00747]|uniref:hypothetical protein n=1 Tax=Gardnerella sp. KA00747 TaxID=2749078 RepID=UPI003BAB9D64